MGSNSSGRGGYDDNSDGSDDDSYGSDDDSYSIDDSDDSSGDSCRIIIGGTGHDDAGSAGRPQAAAVSWNRRPARTARGAAARR